MPSDPLKSLGECVAALAADAVRTQERFDDAARREREVFATILAQGPDDLAALLRPLAPPRLFVASHRVSAELRVKVERSASFTIQAKPIHLGYAMTRRSTELADARLVVDVEQVLSADFPKSTPTE